MRRHRRWCCAAAFLAGGVAAAAAPARAPDTHSPRSKEFEGQRKRAQFGAVSLSFRF